MCKGNRQTCSSLPKVCRIGLLVQSPSDWHPSLSRDGVQSKRCPLGWSALNWVATLLLRASCLGNRGDKLKRLKKHAPSTFIYLTADSPVAHQQPGKPLRRRFGEGVTLLTIVLDYLLDWPLCTEKTAQESIVRLVSSMGVECDVNILHHVATGQL